MIVSEYLIVDIGLKQIQDKRTLFLIKQAISYRNQPSEFRYLKISLMGMESSHTLLTFSCF